MTESTQNTPQTEAKRRDKQKERGKKTVAQNAQKENEETEVDGGSDE